MPVADLALLWNVFPASPNIFFSLKYYVDVDLEPNENLLVINNFCKTFYHRCLTGSVVPLHCALYFSRVNFFISLEIAAKYCF